MVSLSEGRFGLAGPGKTANGQLFGGVDTSTAQAIQSFGGIAGQAYQGHIQGKLLNEFQQTANEIGTINAGQAAIQDAVRSGNIDPTSQRFQRLAAATDQGKISQQRARIESEVILREAISQNPGFGDVFREEARSALGFDPSNSSLQQLLMSGPDASKTAPLTESQKDMQTAESLVAGGAFASTEEAFKQIQRNKAAELQESIDKADIQTGKMSVGKVAVSAANRATNKFNGIMLGALAQVNSAGGVRDVEQFKAGINAQAELMKSQIENEMANSGRSYGMEEYNQVRARIDEQAASYNTLLDNQDSNILLARRLTELTTLTETKAIEIAPALALLTHMPLAVQESAFDLMLLAGDDQNIIDELIAQDPRKAFAQNLALDLKSVGASITAMDDGTLKGLLDSRTIDPETAKAVTKNAAHDVIDGKETLDIAKVYEGLKDTDLPITALDMVSKTASRSFTDMPAQQRARVAEDIGTASAQQMMTINRVLSGAQGQGLKLAFSDGQFRLQDTTGRSARELIGGFAPSGFISPEAEADYIARNSGSVAANFGLEEAIDLMNDTIVPIMQDQRWAAQAGYANGRDWAVNMVNSVNVSSLRQEVEQGGPILESLGMGDQAAFRKAWRSGDLQTAIGILTNVADAGLQDGSNINAFQTADNLTGVPFQEQQTAQPATDPLAETRAAEGSRASVYPDPGGIPTIGYGHNLKANPLTPEIKQQLGLDPNIADEDLVLTQDQQVQLLSIDAARELPVVVKAIPGFQDLDQRRKVALADMAINLGGTGVKGFTRMVDAINSGDFNTAADELLDSAYARGWVRNTDTGDWIRDADGTIRIHGGLVERAKMNAEKMRNGG